jgi:hypothetical protein
VAVIIRGLVGWVSRVNLPLGSGSGEELGLELIRIQPGLHNQLLVQVELIY